MATERYCVFGNPIAHSRSPAIHALFARQTGQDLEYTATLVDVAGSVTPDAAFAEAVHDFIAAGGKGANVTVPFKEPAWRLADKLTPRAESAGAVNTLLFSRQAGRPHILGDNTDGAGLVCDIQQNLGLPIAGKRILLLGAGGAARGVLMPLLAEKPERITVANRSADKAESLVRSLASTRLNACALSDLEKLSAYDMVINATAASLSGNTLSLPQRLYAPGALAYDMMYGQAALPFQAKARAQGAAICADGLGMLVEQAAESFWLWRQVRPQTAGVLREMRGGLGG